MMLHVAEVLTKQQVAEIRRELDGAEWADGRATAGAQGALVKRNRQLPPGHALGRRIGEELIKRLGSHPQFVSAALPRQLHPPLFNLYEGGGSYGLHVDAAVMHPPGATQPLRSDVSCTLFLCEPEDYEGGELVVVDTYGSHEAKLPAGDMVLYPSTSLHRVEPVRAGVRVCSFFWVQSLVRDDKHRTMLYELDQTIQSLRAGQGDTPEVMQLTAHYHNLLRQWAEV